MKIRYQLLLMMVFLCLTFLGLGSLVLFQNSVLTFTLITIGFFSLIALLLLMFFVKRIERLNIDLANVQSGTSSTLKANAVSHDEISEISSRVNVLLETIKLSRQQLFFLAEKSNENNEIPMTSLLNEFDLTHVNDHQDEGVRLTDRVHFNEALSKTISYVKRHNKLAAILIIDIDLVSDVMVAKASLSNTVIMEIAKKFSSVLRNEDVLAKLDGNEFIVLLNDIGKTKFVSTVAEKLLQIIATGVYVDYKELLLKASIGISVCPNDAVTLEESIEKTYTALYKAKSTSSNYYQFYEKEMDIEAHEYMSMKGALQRAVQNNELVLNYQPKLSIKKGSVVGVEALIRWVHPTLGLLSPDKFLDVAEDSGCIIAIGDWALREACKTNMHWQNEGYEHIVVALNLSKKQFFHPNLLKTLTSILEETKLKANYVELEINEETIMSDLEKTTSIMKSIAELGVQMSIDHFGKGYTSISHLKHLPISTIKIDRGFIEGVPNNPNDAAITSAIIALAHYLGIFALAERVENAEQLQFLTQQQCDMVQGYFLSYPLPVESVIQHFKKISDRALSS